jgi:glycosyltransferase involved in cell wall biosynthesis
VNRSRVAHVTTVDGTLRFILLGQMRRLRDEGFDVSAVSARGPYAAELEAEGIRHIDWPHATRSWDPVSDARAFFELLSILRRERFDIVHTHTPKPNIMGRIAARLAGVPCVVNSVHGFYAMPEDPAMKRIPVIALERFAARFSDLELYDSAEDLAWAQRIGLVKGSKGRFIGNGVDLKRFDPSNVLDDRLAALRKGLGIPEGSLVVGAVGRLVAEKGYRELFAAAREIRRAKPDTRFLILGAPDREKADAISSSEIARAEEDVIFTGWVDDVRDLMALMDVFVLPSYREGQPVSAIEAAAMGRPMVLSDIRGCREVVTDGVNGLLVPARDARALAAAINRFLEDADLRHRMGESARDGAVERFDEDKIAGTIVSEYRILLARKGIQSGRTGRQTPGRLNEVHGPPADR